MNAFNAKTGVSAGGALYCCFAVFGFELFFGPSDCHGSGGADDPLPSLLGIGVPVI